MHTQPDGERVSACVSFVNSLSVSLLLASNSSMLISLAVSRYTVLRTLFIFRCCLFVDFVLAIFPEFFFLRTFQQSTTLSWRIREPEGQEARLLRVEEVYLIMVGTLCEREILIEKHGYLRRRCITYARYTYTFHFISVSQRIYFASCFTDKERVTFEPSLISLSPERSILLLTFLCASSWKKKRGRSQLP